MKIETLKAIELKFDYNIYPRCKDERLDTTNIRRIKDAIEAEDDIPPIVVDAKDYRIIDGFHRVRAYMQLFGDEAKIKAELRNYHNDAERLMDSVRLNAKHGLPFSPTDKVHAALTLHRMKQSIAAIAEALGMMKSSLQRLIDENTAFEPSGKRIPIKFSLRKKFRGETLTEEQVKMNDAACGAPAHTIFGMFLAILKNNAFDMTKSNLSKLIEIRDLLDKIIPEEGAR